jgi:hypothetical protein
VISYNALNLKFTNFETPCIIKSRSESFCAKPETESRSQLLEAQKDLLLALPRRYSKFCRNPSGLGAVSERSFRSQKLTNCGKHYPLILESWRGEFPTAQNVIAVQ